VWSSVRPFLYFFGVGREIGDGRQRDAGEKRGEPGGHDAADGDDRAR